MEPYMAYVVAIGLIVGGASMILWSADAALNSLRDGPDDTRPASLGEIWYMRAIGAFMAAGGAYCLYARITNMPGPGGGVGV